MCVVTSKGEKKKKDKKKPRIGIAEYKLLADVLYWATPSNIFMTACAVASGYGLSISLMSTQAMPSSRTEQWMRKPY
jgi:hypothetical protein